MLSKQKFELAKSFILAEGRELDKALFNHEFLHEKPTLVIEELKTYQNIDGGFGNAIEPDIRLKSSSVLATTVGLQYLNDLDLKRDFPMAEKAISYLVDNLLWHEIEENGVEFPYWNSVPLKVKEAPHAPWWSIDEVKPPSLNNWANPNVEVIAYFNQYKNYISNRLLDKLNSSILGYLELVPIIKGLTHPSGVAYYNFYCWKRALPHVPDAVFEKIIEMLDESIDEQVLHETNFEAVFPHWLVTEKSSYLFEKYPEIMRTRLTQEIARQQNNGGWGPTWKWGTEQVWAVVEKEWTGKLTVETLGTLKHCEMIPSLDKESS